MNTFYRHQSGSKIRLKEDDYKLIDDDGNVVLVLTNVKNSHNFSCTIMNEIAENSTSCQVVVNHPNKTLVHIDEDVIRYAVSHESFRKYFITDIPWVQDL